MELSISDMLDMQLRLREKYKNSWGELTPRVARDQLLWALIEAGEAADIIKKWGDEAILNDPEARKNFIEEIGDTLMYLMDVLHCYDISADEFADIYRKKFTRNMTRWD